MRGELDGIVTARLGRLHRNREPGQQDDQYGKEANATAARSNLDNGMGDGALVSRQGSALYFRPDLDAADGEDKVTMLCRAQVVVFRWPFQVGTAKAALLAAVAPGDAGR